jgi:hypothetical protein
MVEQHPSAMFRRGQVADPERDRACRPGQGVTKRHSVTSGASGLDSVFGCPDRLVRKSLQPQNMRKHGARRHPLIEFKPNDVEPVFRIDVISEHALDMASRAG